jgi:hypothetical protein
MKKLLRVIPGLLLIALVSMFFLAVPVNAVDPIQSIQNGNWNAATTWQGGVVPGQNDDVAISHTVTLPTNASVTNIKFYNQGKVNLGNRKLSVFGDLVDNTPTESAPVYTTGSGFLSFEGAAEQKIKSETAKTLETRIQAKIEVKQKVTLEKNVCLMEQVRLVDKDANQGFIDINSKKLILKKDLVDDSTIDEAITDNGSEGSGKVSFEGSAEQKIKSQDSLKDEISINADVEVKQKVKLEKNVRMKKSVALADKDVNNKGYIDIAGKNLALENHLSDDSTAPEAIKNSQSTGKVSFENSWLIVITSGSKTAETVIQAQVEVAQRVDLLKDVRLKEKLKLVDKGGNQGSVNIGGCQLSIEKDLVDDSSAAEAIINSTPGSGKISFEGTAEQKIKSDTGKTQETKIKAIMEVKQKVKLEKDVRVQENMKLADKDANNKGYIDVAGKNLALEKDLVDNGSASKAIINSNPASGKISFDGVEEQKIKSDTGKTQETKIDCKAEIRKPTNKLVVVKKTSMTKVSFGASDLTDPQEVELQEQSTINVDETLQEAKIKQSTSSGSKITSKISSTISTVNMVTSNQVLVKKGSLIIEVIEGNPVVVTFAGIVVTIPLNTKALIEEPVTNTFNISNISDTAAHPDAGSIIVTVGGETVQVAPGERPVTVTGNTEPSGVGGEVEPVNRANVLLPWLGLAMVLAFASLIGIWVAKKYRVN